MTITIELFGVPRLRARVAMVRVEASTAGEALRSLASLHPELGNLLRIDGFLHPAYRLIGNGDRFVLGPDELLEDGETLLLMAADAGG